MIIKDIILKKIKKTFPLFTSFAFIGSIISDILQPIAPFTGYLFFLSSILFIISLFTYFFLKSLRAKIENILIFNVIILIISGSFYLLQKNQKSENGILSNIKSIEILQSSFGLIDKNLDQINITTKSIDSKIGGLNENLKKLSNIGGLVSNPNSPSDFYHNSIIFRQRGEIENALKALNQFFSYELLFHEPINDFVNIYKKKYPNQNLEPLLKEYFKSFNQIFFEYSKLIAIDKQDFKKIDINFWTNQKMNFAPAYLMILKKIL